jgi:hypothetical protein
MAYGPGIPFLDNLIDPYPGYWWHGNERSPSVLSMQTEADHPRLSR